MARLRRFALCVAVVATVRAQSAALPQTVSSQAPQALTYRASTTLVPIDVRVFDSHGQPVIDLRRKDFTIFEDDDRQDVALFTATALSPAVPDLDPRHRVRSAASDEDAQVFSVVHGNLAAPDPFRGAVVPVAPVVTPSAATMAAMSVDPRGGVDPLIAASGHRTENLSQMAAESLRRVAGAASNSDVDLEKLNTAIDVLRHDDGEKHLVFMASTPPTFARQEDVDALIRAANDARVVIDVAQQGACGCWGAADLERLAHATGGVAALYMSPEHAHDAIVAANQFEYQLGYYPSKTTLDERYRRLRVEVDRPGLTLAYRTGYYARRPALVLPPDVKRRYDRVSAALRTSLPARGLQLTATAHGQENGTDRHVAVHVVVAPAGLPLTLADGLHVGSLDVVVIVSNRDGALVGRSWNTLDVSLDDDAYQRFLAAGFTIDQSVPLTSSGTAVKIVVYDPSSDRVGSVTLDVK